jgi:hypothetical protein
VFVLQKRFFLFAKREDPFFGPGSGIFLLEFASGRRRLPVENWIHFPVSKATGLKRKPSKELNRWEYAKTGAQLF